LKKESFRITNKGKNLYEYFLIVKNLYNNLQPNILTTDEELKIYLDEEKIDENDFCMINFLKEELNKKYDNGLEFFIYIINSKQFSLYVENHLKKYKRNNVK